jgi:hypothetical protein
LRELSCVECQSKIGWNPRDHEEQQKDQRELNERLPGATIYLTEESWNCIPGHSL